MSVLFLFADVVGFSSLVQELSLYPRLRMLHFRMRGGGSTGGRDGPCQKGSSSSLPQLLIIPPLCRGIAMFNKVDVKVLGLVQNMAFFQCPCCKVRALPKLSSLCGKVLVF